MGFAGSIVGGAAPYELNYVLTSRSGGGTINLGTQLVPVAGYFVTPPAFIAPLAGLNDDFDVLVSGSDASATPFPTTAIFVAAVRNPCAIPAPQTGTALTYPGPFTYAPATGAAAAPTGAAIAPPAPATQNPGTSGPTTGGSSPTPGLASTGSDIPLLATISMLLLSVGGVLMVASRREERTEH